MLATLYVHRFTYFLRHVYLHFMAVLRKIIKYPRWMLVQIRRYLLYVGTREDVLSGYPCLKSFDFLV